MRSAFSCLCALLACGCALDRSPIGGSRDGGQPPQPDSGEPDSGECMAAAEVCNGRDDDCDGSADEGFDLTGDPMHCGACGNVCPSGPGGRTTCAASACLLECDPGRDDCDRDPRTGCEADLTDPSSCGACGVRCEAPAPLCVDEGTGLRCASACPPGTMQCGGTCANVDTDLRHCGACGNACPAPPGTVASCTEGTCGFSCLTDLGDCDGNLTNGCESSLRTLATCGSCMTACAIANATASCDTGSCVRVACDAGFDDCDMAPGNGCETSVRTPTDCGTCGTPCALTNAVATCATGACAIESCAAGFADCNATASDGCEVNVATDPMSCGTCGTRCASGETCRGSTCRAAVVVVEVAAGNDFSCARLSDGRVFCWGSNASGQLGDGTTMARTSVVPVSGITNAISISAGGSHACAVRMGGQVLCWGVNDRCQVGSTPCVMGTPVTTPTAVAGVSDATHVGAGQDHTCVVRATGSVACWGANNQDQLGRTTGGDTAMPGDATGVTMAVRVGSGNQFSCARRMDGSVSCWGKDNQGQLGDGMGGGVGAVTVSGLTDAVHLGVGHGHACAVRMGGSVICWGQNGEGQLGDGMPGTNAHSPVMVSPLTNAVQVSPGTLHTCARRAGGSVSCWGRNEGRLGDGMPATMRSVMPVDVMGLSDAIDVAAGGDHTCAARAAGGAACWGLNGSRQLGDGSMATRATPVAVVDLPPPP